MTNHWSPRPLPPKGVATDVDAADVATVMIAARVVGVEAMVRVAGVEARVKVVGVEATARVVGVEATARAVRVARPPSSGRSRSGCGRPGPTETRCSKRWHRSSARSPSRCCLAGCRRCARRSTSRTRRTVPPGCPRSAATNWSPWPRGCCRSCVPPNGATAPTLRSSCSRNSTCATCVRWSSQPIRVRATTKAARSPRSCARV